MATSAYVIHKSKNSKISNCDSRFLKTKAFSPASIGYHRVFCAVGFVWFFFLADSFSLAWSRRRSAKQEFSPLEEKERAGGVKPSKKFLKRGCGLCFSLSLDRPYVGC